MIPLSDVIMVRLSHSCRANHDLNPEKHSSLTLKKIISLASLLIPDRYQGYTVEYGLANLKC